MEIIKNALRIRKATESDANILCRWWNDGNLMVDVGFPHGLGATETHVKRQIKHAHMQNMLILEVETLPVGEAHYTKLDKGTATLGIKIGQLDMQNKGYGTLFMHMLIKELFYNLGTERIIINVDLENKRAQHLYEKIGFTKLETHMDTWTDQLGILRGHIDYELRQENWQA